MHWSQQHVWLDLNHSLAKIQFFFRTPTFLQDNFIQILLTQHLSYHTAKKPRPFGQGYMFGRIWICLFLDFELYDQIYQLFYPKMLSGLRKSLTVTIPPYSAIFTKTDEWSMRKAKLAWAMPRKEEEDNSQPCQGRYCYWSERLRIQLLGRIYWSSRTNLSNLRYSDRS